MVFHVLNRGVARMQLLEKAADYQAFEQVLQDTLDQSPMRICAYAGMPNHWHLLLWPECDGELAAFMQRLTITHVRRWQEHRGYAGLGHVYQGRYKSFPVESDEHFCGGTWGQTDFQVNLKLGLTPRRRSRAVQNPMAFLAVILSGARFPSGGVPEPAPAGPRCLTERRHGPVPGSRTVAQEPSTTTSMGTASMPTRA